MSRTKGPSDTTTPVAPVAMAKAKYKESHVEWLTAKPIWGSKPKPAEFREAFGVKCLDQLSANDRAFQSFPNTLNRFAASWVQRTVCWMFLWPR